MRDPASSQDMWGHYPLAIRQLATASHASGQREGHTGNNELEKTDRYVFSERGPTAQLIQHTLALLDFQASIGQEHRISGSIQ
jgi:hypothetical protein